MKRHFSAIHVDKYIDCNTHISVSAMNDLDLGSRELVVLRFS